MRGGSAVGSQPSNRDSNPRSDATLKQSTFPRKNADLSFSSFQPPYRFFSAFQPNLLRICILSGDYKKDSLAN